VATCGPVVSRKVGRNSAGHDVCFSAPSLRDVGDASPLFSGR